MKLAMGLFILFFILAVTSKAALADARNIDKMRKFYREHNLDFFGELISGQDNFLDDEKRHAKLELLADDARTKALNQLDHLLKTAHGPIEAELLLRKATLLSDRARTATYFQNNPFKASKLGSPEVYLRGAIDVFELLSRKYPDHPKMDVVLFSIAYNYGELKRVDFAFKSYAKLIQKYPDSALVGDARLALAEIYFDKRQFGNALSELREIVKVNHPRLKNFALYKMAWTYYNMSDLDSAAHALEQVIEGVNSSGVQHARLELRKEALHDLVTFFAEKSDLKGAMEASTYFGRIAQTPEIISQEYALVRAKRLESYRAKNMPLPDEEQDSYQVTEVQDLLFRLVQVYRDQGKHEQSMVVAEQLLEKLERHPRTVALYRLRAEAAEKLRRRDKVIVELERFAKIIESELKPIDAYKNGLPETAYSDLNKTFEEEKSPVVTFALAATLSPDYNYETAYQRQLAKLGFDAFNDFSTFLHGEWTKTQNGETARQALAIYDLALHAFLTPWRGQKLEAVFELQRRRAELRFATKAWDLAAQDFHELAKHVSGPRTLILEVTQGEIAALEALLKEQNIQPAKGKDIAPLHLRLLSAYDAFFSNIASDEKLRDKAAGVLSASARLYRDYGLQNDALRRQRFYALTFHDQKDSINATHDVLSLLSEQFRWEDLRDVTEKLASLGHYKNTNLEKEIVRSREYAMLRILENLEKEKNWERAEKEFANFAEKNPNSPYVSQSLIKSANAALETKNIESAILRLQAATLAPDPAVQLQAWLGLEPFYRKAYQWRKLKVIYAAILKSKSEAKTLDGAKTNFNQLKELEKEAFNQKGLTLVADDPSLKQWHSSEEKFEKSVMEFKKLRFVKSNLNPALNFKKKADMHAKLTKLADDLSGAAPKSLSGAALIWANTVKSELLLEFAETLEGAALPAALKAASAEDKKSYSDTISSQTQELRTQSHALALEAVKLSTQVDCPFDSEERLNTLLGQLKEQTRLTRTPFSPVWTTRPGAVRRKPANIDDAEITRLGLKILEAKKPEESRESLLQLAQLYFDADEPGFAYAILPQVITENDEISGRARHLQFEIDAARLPESTRTAATKNNLIAEQRWLLARWIAGNLATIKNSGGLGFSKDELEWLTEANHALLRTTPSHAPTLVGGLTN